MITKTESNVKPEVQVPGYTVDDHSLAKVEGKWRHGVALKGERQEWLIVGGGRRMRLYRSEGAIAKPTSARGELGNILRYIEAHDAFVGATAN